MDLPLRDIHLPEPVSWWPPAIGWWLLLLGMVLLLGLGWRAFKLSRTTRAIKQAKLILGDMRTNSTLTDIEKIKALSLLLRRVCLTYESQNDIASLTGEAWLTHLDQSLPNHPFTTGIGRYLASAPYQRQCPNECDIDALFDLCEQWLKGQGS
jgi:hypothetical protein